MIESAIYKLLSTDPDVTALATGGIYPVLMPEFVAYPAISYMVVDSPPVETLLEPVGIARPRFQIDAWANSYLDAKQVNEAVRHCLDGYIGPVETTSGTVKIRGIRFADDRDSYEKDTRTFHSMHDFFVWYELD